MTDRDDLLELIAKQVTTLATQVDSLTKDMADIKTTMATQVDSLTKDMADIKTTMATQVDSLTKDMADIKTTMATQESLQKVKNIVVKIENDHGQKLGALFDGYKLNSEKLDRIESKITKHEEFILKRIR